ncbi:hypothetical protein M0R45_002816 [Rubus argutus]|uniref:DUF1995 domain-containing protein n=1 Tax=Rubus argutus TaxID=59490 RepID=A0AAW1VNX9_RUBAR
MASNLLKIHTKTIRTPNPATPFSLPKTLSFTSLPFPTHHQHSQISLPSTLANKSKIPTLSLLCSLSSPTPPNSKEAAIQQAKTCLTTTLEKPLNNLRLTNKLKKLKQPRFRIEIPVADDSPESLSQLAPAALKAFESRPSSPVQHFDISSIANGNTRILSDADVAVFLAPEGSQLAVMKTVVDLLFFSFMGLEVKGLLSKRNGVIFKCVRDGVVSGEKWAVLVEEEQGELKLVSTFKSRPSIAEVEYVLYNLMAMNSPVTKSVKFFRDLVSNVTGKK